MHSAEITDSVPLPFRVSTFNIFCKSYRCIFQWHTLIRNTGNLLKQICDLHGIETVHCFFFCFFLLNLILELPGRKKDLDMCSWLNRITHLIASVCYFWLWTSTRKSWVYDQIKPPFLWFSFSILLLKQNITCSPQVL